MRNPLLLSLLLAATSWLSAAQAPDFSITDSDGNTRHLYADYVNQGKVVVLEVFFTTCPPCATHAPYWQSLYETVKNQYPGQLEFFMLSDKSADLNTAVAQYKTSKSLTMPAAGSDGGSLSAVQPYKSGQFGPFYGTPTFIVIKPGSGEVVFDIRGNNPAGTMDLIRQEIDQMLVSGCRIETFQGDTLQNYGLKVQVPGGGAAVNYPVTGGSYSLESITGLPALPFFEVLPFKNDDPLNGVSTFDLLQINKQILGVELFQEPWQFVAADANNSGTISTFDIVELRKLILGIYDTLPDAPSWVFSPPMDTLSPLDCPLIHAIKKGDVNGNADPAGLLAADDRDADPWTLLLENRPIPSGERFILPVRAGQTALLQGLQFALRLDPSALEVLSVRGAALPGLDVANWHCTGESLRLSWFAAPAVEVRAGETLLLLELRARRDLVLADAIHAEPALLRGEGYDAGNGTHPLAWRFLPESSTSATIFPNPARQQFVLRMESKAPEATTLRLINAQGRVAWEQPLWLNAGTALYEIRPGKLPGGLYTVWAAGKPQGKLLWLD